MKNIVFIAFVLIGMLSTALLYFNDFIGVDILNISLLVLTVIWFLGSLLIHRKENLN